jgi:hypothetical protein
MLGEKFDCTKLTCYSKVFGSGLTLAPRRFISTARSDNKHSGKLEAFRGGDIFIVLKIVPGESPHWTYDRWRSRIVRCQFDLKLARTKQTTVDGFSPALTSVRRSQRTR